MDLGTPHLVCDTPRPGVLRVTLDRPERRNACTREMYEGLRAAVAHAEAAADVRVLVLTGRDPAFCAGGDLKAGAERPPDPSPDPRAALGERLARILPFDDLERAGTPVVAAVNGPAMGGGLILTLLSDVVVASDRAWFRAPELRRGIADAWVTTRLPAIVGLTRARWMLMTGATVDADEALRIGLVADVVPHDDLADASLDAAAEIARAAPGAIAAAKRAIARSMPAPDMDGFLTTLASPEAAEGMRAFAERRDASWVPGAVGGPGDPEVPSSRG